MYSKREKIHLFRRGEETIIGVFLCRYRKRISYCFEKKLEVSDSKTEAIWSIFGLCMYIMLQENPKIELPIKYLGI